MISSEKRAIHNEKNIDKLDRDLKDFRSEVLKKFDQVDQQFDKVNDIISDRGSNGYCNRETFRLRLIDVDALLIELSPDPIAYAEDEECVSWA